MTENMQADEVLRLLPVVFRGVLYYIILTRRGFVNDLFAYLTNIIVYGIIKVWVSE